MGTNLKNIFTAVWIVLFAALIVFPAPSLAAVDCKNPKNDAERCQCFKDQFTVGSGSNTINIIGDSPMFCSASDLILKVIDYALIMSGTITVLFLIIGGFWYLTSAGNEEQAEKGKKTLINSVIGLVVIILAFTIVRIVAATISSVAQ